MVGFIAWISLVIFLLPCTGSCCWAGFVSVYLLLTLHCLCPFSAESFLTLFLFYVLVWCLFCLFFVFPFLLRRFYLLPVFIPHIAFFCFFCFVFVFLLVLFSQFSHNPLDFSFFSRPDITVMADWAWSTTLLTSFFSRPDITVMADWAWSTTLLLSSLALI